MTTSVRYKYEIIVLGLLYYELGFPCELLTTFLFTIGMFIIRSTGFANVNNSIQYCNVLSPPGKHLPPFLEIIRII